MVVKAASRADSNFEAGFYTSEFATLDEPLIVDPPPRADEHP